MTIHQSLKTAIAPDVSTIVILTVLSTFGGRILISEIQEECPELLSNDYIKIVILYSMLYMALRHKEENQILSSAYWCILIIAVWKYFKDNLAKDFCIEKKCETPPSKNKE